MSDNDALPALPLPEIPPPPKRGAVRSLANVLERRTLPDGEVGLDEAAAEAVASSVVDPAATRTVSLKRPSYQRVPGGTLTIIREDVFVTRMVTFPVNPRVLGEQRFPAAGGDAVSLLAFDRDLTEVEEHAELLLRASTRRQVARVLQDHGKWLRELNPGLKSIRDVGVLRPITVVPMRISTADEEKPAITVLVSVEGSSRTAWSHHIQGVDPAEPVFGRFQDPRTTYELARELGDVRHTPEDELEDENDLARARTLIIPAEIVIGFTPDPESSNGTLLGAVDQVLGLTHVDPPKPWAAAAVSATLADKALNELRAEAEIKEREHMWLAGMLTESEAKTAKLDPWLARRAAKLLWLLSREKTSSVGRIVARGIRRGSVEMRLTPLQRGGFAAALALRALDDGLDDEKAIRAALPRAMSMAVLHENTDKDTGDWSVTDRHVDELRDLALTELGDDEPGPAMLEMAALATWVFTTRGLLRRGRSKKTGGDPRDPQTLIMEMLGSEYGIRVLHRALADDHADRYPRRINSKLRVERAGDKKPVRMDETWLRKDAFPDPDREPEAETSTDPAAMLTPRARFDRGLKTFGGDVEHTAESFHEIESLADDDGKPMIDRVGIDPEFYEHVVIQLSELQSGLFKYRPEKASDEEAEEEDGDEDDDERDD